MRTELAPIKFDFVKPTAYFLIVGFFIPGFTAIALVCLQMLITVLGIACSTAWGIIWLVAIFAGLFLPLWFYRQIKYMAKENSGRLKSRLATFNLLEYMFIQAGLTPFFTSGQTFCYVSDGQNGLELVFTAWLALPILLCLSFPFNQALKRPL